MVKTVQGEKKLEVTDAYEIKSKWLKKREKKKNNTCIASKLNPYSKIFCRSAHDRVA